MLVTGDEVSRPVVGLAAPAEVGVRQFDVRQPAEQGLKEAPQLQAGQVVAEAEVGARPEREVVVRHPCHVEPERVLENRGVPVRRRIEQQQLLPGRKLLAAELGVGHHGARHVLDRADPAQHLLDRGRHERAVGEQALPL